MDPPTGATHGWDNALDSMGGLLLMAGPGIPAGLRVPAVHAVDLYPFMARLLGLDAPPTEGSPEALGWLLEAGAATSPRCCRPPSRPR